MKRLFSLVALGMVLTWIGPADAQVQLRIGDPPQDFPPGPFTDGGQYSVSDFKDKILVLYFFEGNPKCKPSREKIPERSAVVRAFQGQPVKFFGVVANLTLPQAQAFQNETGLSMPIFVDSLGLMQSRYGFKIMLKGNAWQNAWQTRVYGPNGLEDTEMDKETIEKVLRKTAIKPKYNLADYDAKMRPALELLEFGQLGSGLKALAPFTKSTKKGVAEAAKKVFADIKTDVVKWKVDADDMAGLEPLKAYDLYHKVIAALPNDELSKSAAAAAKKLATDKSVAPELGARKAYVALTQSMGQYYEVGRPYIMQSCKTIMKKYPGTPTAEKVDDLFKELGGKGAK